MTLYVLFIAAWITGFWEMIASVKEEFRFWRCPKGMWFMFQVVFPALGLYLWNRFLVPVSLYAYVMIYIGILHVHRKELLPRLTIFLSYLFFGSFLILVTLSSLELVNLVVVLLVAGIAVAFFLVKKCVLWMDGLLLLWILFQSNDALVDLYQTSLLGALLFLYSFERNVRARIAHERDHDVLTGLMNRRGFRDWLASRKNERQFGTLAVIDLDDFKLINDTYGHLAGDYILTEVGRRLCNSSRMDDVIVRFGGDEFVLVLPNSNLDQAYEFILRLHRELVQQKVTLPELDREIVLRASIGVAEGEIGSELFQMADQVLLQVKREGKNRVGFKKAHQDSE
ncbi:hypothetical protein BM613_08290 [Sulfoacidibacillus thermotolerans]|uniref:GGDEF domain-containing protein n=2 Tax=Sulfoacidibacillus thermotolerans TaxID=1765684 RepID=A0A2U3D845_SULT2|nr:hypothetical protein BM613_08290 [Sulfoacidibacillus thermotolerans]